MKKATENNFLKALSIFLILLPNLHFWSSNIGKEALLLLPVVLFIFEIHRKKYFSVVLLTSLFSIALIRPHLAFIMMLSYGCTIFIILKFSNLFKIKLLTLFILSTGLFAFLLMNLQDFSGGFPRILKKYDAHIQYFKKTDGYVPLDQYNLPYKIFTFYFRPLPFEKSGLLYQMVSIENTVLFLIFLSLSFYAIKYFRFLSKRVLFVFPLLFLLMYALMYVYAYANFGIIIRTKMMALPFFYVLILEVMEFVISKSQKHKMQSYNNTNKII